MNLRLVAKYLGFFCLATGVFMIPAAAWAVYFDERNALIAFIASMAIAAGLAAALAFAGKKADETFSQREALGLVSLSWFAVAAMGSLPYILSGTLGPVDAYFESMSGFTTTGSTVIQNIEATPKSILFWRALSQWIGGMGIVLLFIAVLPYLGAGGKQLFKSESTGPDPHGLSPRIRDTASILYKIYLGMTAAMIAALMIGRMDFFDAVCHAFTTVSTAGFSTRQESIGSFGRVYFEMVVILFMVFAATNFALFFSMIRGERTSLFRDTEWRIFIGVLAAAIALITANLMFGQHRGGAGVDGGYTFLHALRVGAFQTTSIMTTTGFGTDNFDAWPHFSRAILLLLMFVGGCAGSTAGGIKILRLVILAKIAYWRLEQTFRPKTVRAVRVSGLVISDDIQRRVLAFLVLYLMWLGGGTLFMSALGLPLETALSSVVTTLNNIGPGLDLIGAANDFSGIPAVGKLFLTLCMALGRLEMFSVCVLFIPSFWKHS